MALHFVPRSYREHEGYLCRGTNEPKSRSIDVVWGTMNSKWHIKVTFEGFLQSRDAARVPKAKLKRKRDLQELCAQIIFDEIALLRDTVTEVVIYVSENNHGLTKTLPLLGRPSYGLESSNHFAGTHSLRFQVQEDTSRVLYPPASSVSSLPRAWLSTIETIGTIKGKVDIVQTVVGGATNSNNTTLVYKKLGGLLYYPEDTDVFQREVDNLQLCRGVPHVVQPVAIVVSRNPYQTTKAEAASDPVVVRGVLLEHHPHGTLLDVLTLPAPGGVLPWQRWPYQIACGLSSLHLRGIAHMDIKPDNIVISRDGEAIIIDIGGMGFTRDWVAPEAWESPLTLPLRERMQNDIWAFGKVLSFMAEYISNGWEKEELLSVAASACAQSPESRITLSSAAARLEGLSPALD